MRVPLRTLVAIRLRIEQAQVPRLFDDRWSARRVRARRDRIDAWLGPLGRAIVGDYDRPRDAPADRTFSRRPQRHIA